MIVLWFVILILYYMRFSKGLKISMGCSGGCLFPCSDKTLLDRPKEKENTMRVSWYLPGLVLCLIIIGVMWSSTLQASYYTPTQTKNIHEAKRIWKSVAGLPETGAAILLQETYGGTEDLVGDDGKSLGIFHVTEAAAIDVIGACRRGKYKNHCNLIHTYTTDKEGLKLRLLVDDRFNAVVAALYFKIQYDYFKAKKYSRPWTRANMAFNAGRTLAKRMSTASLDKHERIQWIRYRLSNLKRYT